MVTGDLKSKVVDLLEDIPMEDHDTKCDIYEFMLSIYAAVVAFMLHSHGAGSRSATSHV